MSTNVSTMPPAHATPAWIPSPLFRMTVEEYEALVASGAFRRRKRFHLINGLLVEKMTQSPPTRSRMSCAATSCSGTCRPAGTCARPSRSG